MPMLAIYRWVRLFIRKEHFLRSRYHRSHRHFPLYIALDAVVSFAVVFGGFQIANASNSTDPYSVVLEHAGAKALTIPQLVKHIREDGRSVYWLGPKVGYFYSPNCILGDVVTITYIQNPKDLYDLDAPQLAIETYDNSRSYEAHIDAFNENARSQRHIADVSKRVVEIDPARTMAAVWFNDDPHIVVINYPTEQSFDSIMRDADSLRLIY